MAPTLYMVKPSPPVRAVQITAKSLGISLTEKEVDFTKGEHLTPEYLNLNPQHTVPTFVDDDGFAFWDSHAIMIYLVTKYSKDHSLYPVNELKKKAIIDQRLYFDSGVAFPTIAKLTKGLRAGKKGLDQQNIDDINQVYAFLEAFLEDTQWVADDTVTIADYSLFASITTLDVLLPVNAQKFPQVSKWLKKVQLLPEAEANNVGLEVVKELVNKYNSE